MFGLSRSQLFVFTLSVPAMAVATGLTLAGLGLFPAAEMSFRDSAVTAAPETVFVPATRFDYRPAGSYLQHGDPVDPSLEVRKLAGGVTVMASLVSVGDYRRCVDDGICRPADIRADAAADLPVTGVSYLDASDYAAWLSEATGERWRLPTDEEWAFIAGSRAADDAVGVSDGANPAERWLAAYRRLSGIDRSAGTVPLPLGSFGSNEYGVIDLSGNVWEWTATCYERVTLDSAGKAAKAISNCGVRVAEGRHRAYISDFIRDARGGGCSAGAPPDNLGFRLVRDTGWRALVGSFFR